MKENAILKHVLVAEQAIQTAIQVCGDAQAARAGLGDGSLSRLQSVINYLHVASSSLLQGKEKLQDWK